jgi:hypothetical protein
VGSGELELEPSVDPLQVLTRFSGKNYSLSPAGEWKFRKGSKKKNPANAGLLFPKP